MSTLRVLILAFDDVEALDFAGPFEVFTTASRVHARQHPGQAPLFEVRSVAIAKEVRARAGLRLLADHTLADAPAADVLIVPGGVVDAALASQATLDWIAAQSRSARITASVCTGAFLLAASGVLQGDARCTTHWEDIADLHDRFPQLDVVDDVRWVDNGRIVSSAGISAGIDMSLHLVERLAGRDLALCTARQMDFAWTTNLSNPSA
ncbi:DJ-1/PfpI family protein [Variovorax sp. OV329]|uniref:DJ-1/PfpI family protein n=1 Tax=Variovorax sp. OV329 TaxID=1882825 RepID=UPI0008E909E7|nr:DJ-1/PfpI family protein [Variovorax sp. OV329]SFM08011.1 DJ-1/PfpI family protein [Variovorax sp. OV329]